MLKKYIFQDIIFCLVYFSFLGYIPITFLLIRILVGIKILIRTFSRFNEFELSFLLYSLLYHFHDEIFFPSSFCCS
jgi:hypothetical protein